MYMQKSLQYHDGRVYGSDAEGKLCKGIMTFMIVGLKNNIPFVIKSIPESKIEGQCLAEEIDDSMKSLHEVGFNVCAAISDNHTTNVSAFRNLYQKFGTTQINAIAHSSSPAGLVTYLFYDSVHLVKNIRNNLLNTRRFIFPPFEFDEFLDFISLRGGELSWKLLDDVYDKDQSLKANLLKAHQLTNKVLHPGDNKQSVPLALAVFDPTTSAALSSYFPENQDAAKFLNRTHIWWTISNSKQQYNTNNRIGNAACINDRKSLFLRKRQTGLAYGNPGKQQIPTSLL